MFEGKDYPTQWALNPSAYQNMSNDQGKWHKKYFSIQYIYDSFLAMILHHLIVMQNSSSPFSWLGSISSAMDQNERDCSATSTTSAYY